ncbi:hypothetical protein [Tsukamurella tyrosinosolvens]|uniref:hypothetical protein n=1 Tax=Tsukamurella tyrosinosolvens TaxID=57704 RepID=UPI003F4A46FE
MTDDEFFSATDELKTIYQWARARFGAPWAVFLAVLLRVAVSVPPTVQLPGLIGGRASLNLGVVFVGPSGTGKGVTDKIARLAWPKPLTELPLGSGEGISSPFKEPKDGGERCNAVLFSVSEIDTFTGIASRQGSTLKAQLKAALMGEMLGMTNASEATSRLAKEHSYRLGLSISAQPGHTGSLFDDTTGGTPQRFLWPLAIDPDMPATPGPEPAPLDTAPPMWRAGRDGVVEIQYGTPEIADTVIAAHLARQRGEGDALDGHALLTRCKVAALIAIMHRRSVVSDIDWQLSATVMERSDQTRAWLLSEAKRMDREKIRGRALARAAGEEFISDRRLERAMKAVIRWLEKAEGNELPANILRSKLKADLRDHLGAALAELVDRGSLIEISVDRGHRYRLNSESTGCTEVQGPSLQVSKGVPQVQGVLSGLLSGGSAAPQTPPKSTNEVEMPAPPAAPRRCTVCFLDLPAADLTGVCDDCGDGEQIQRPDPAPARELRPVTMGQLDRRRLKGLAI